MGPIRKLEVLNGWIETPEETAGEDQEGDALSVGAAWVKGDPLWFWLQTG